MVGDSGLQVGNGSLEADSDYPHPDDFTKTGKTLDELRAIAMDNLRRRATGRMVTGSDGLYLISAGGNIDASLILLDEVWKDARLQFAGEPLIAVPDRNTLIACDSTDEPIV